jgi:hypothetical protein
LDEARSAIRLRESCRDLEQGRFAGPVAADDAHPLARPDIECGAPQGRVWVREYQRGDGGWFVTHDYNVTKESDVGVYQPRC